MNAKLQNVMDQTSKELQTQTKLFEDKREADIKSQQVLMDLRETQLKRNFSEMSLSYQKKIDKMQTENDMKMKLITNDYEIKLKEISALSSKELAAKDASRNTEIDKLKETYDAEKSRIVSAYNPQIDSIKRSHEEQIRQMSDYKRLT